MYSIQKFTTSPTQVGRWSSLRRASKLPKMLGHPLKGVNQDFLPLDAWTRRGEGRIALILDRINITKMSYFLTKIFQHPICVTVSKAALKSIVYKPSGSPLHSFTSRYVWVPVNGDRKMSISNEHTSTQQFFYSYSISLYSDQIFSKTPKHHFLARNQKKNFAESR